MASRQPHFGGGFGDDRGDEFVVQDLHDGLNEWRNIQDIVRLSFVAFHKALQAQGDAIFALTEETERRALKSDVRLGFETHEELLNVRVRELKADAEAKQAVGVDWRRRQLTICAGAWTRRKRAWTGSPVRLICKPPATTPNGRLTRCFASYEGKRRRAVIRGGTP